METAQAFVDDLFRNGRIDDQGLVASTARLTPGRRLRTHKVESVAAGIRLQRVLFDCGICQCCR